MRMSMNSLRRWPLLIASILLCEAAGGVGALATRDAIDTWYRELKKPPFNPPDWVFGPVWTILYLLMGIALHDASTSDAERASVRLAQGLFGIQLALNTGWSLIFFGRRSPLYALVEIILLWVEILTTILLFPRLSKRAGILLVPYLLWTTFAAILNFSIWRLNSSRSD